MVAPNLSARTTAGRRPAARRLALVCLATLGVVLGASACTDSATRRLMALSPSRGLSHDDSLRLGSTATLSRSSSVTALDDCDPIDPSCPAVASVIPRPFIGFSQPSPVTINFSGPVRVVSVSGRGAITCSGTFGTLTGFKADGTELGHTDLALSDPSDCSTPENPDNVTFGAEGTLETKSVMAFAVLTAPSELSFPVFDLTGHASQTLTIFVSAGTPEEVAIRVSFAQGPNSGSFTIAPNEQKISLQAELLPADPTAKITWEVIDAPGDRVSAIPPVGSLTGLQSSFLLPQHNKNRWPRNHPGDLDQKTLKYQVTAIADKEGQLTRSTPVFVSQDVLDTIREEYYEFGLASLKRHIPGRNEFSASTHVDVGINTGDYDFAVIEPRFKAKLDELKAAWKGTFQINVIYRNPVHNLNGHIPGSSQSLVSWHMWGCAADLQTFPANGGKAQEKFWKELAALAQDKKAGFDFDVEPIGQSKVGHVHVELDCP